VTSLLVVGDMQEDQEEAAAVAAETVKEGDEIERAEENGEEHSTDSSAANVVDAAQVSAGIAS
jgi:hypothetical protein